MRKLWFFFFYHAAPVYPPPNEAWEPPPAIVDEKPEEKAAIAPLGGNRDCTGVPPEQWTLDCAFSHGQPSSAVSSTRDETSEHSTGQDQGGALKPLASELQSPVRLRGPDLFVDLDNFVGKEVLLIDGTAYAADNDGFLIKAGAVTFKAITEGINRETLRFVLTNCGSLVPEDTCALPMYVTPTGQTFFMSWPILKNARIAR